MKWTRLACALVLALPLCSAFSDVVPKDAQPEWSHYFAGDPVIPDPEVNLEKLIASPEPRCAALQRNIVAETIQYGRLAYDSKKSASEDQAEKILTDLHQLEDSKDTCFDSVARTYIAISLHILNPSNSNVGELFNSLRIYGRPFASGLELTLLGTAILNHGQSVQFLTPLKRTQGMAPVWDQKVDPKQVQSSSEYLVSAGYDCANQVILIDPYLPPLDLASIFVHELDHLFRDRVSFAGFRSPTNTLANLTQDIAALQAAIGGTPLVTSDDSLKDHLSLSLAMDETLASVVSAYFQRHMEWFHDFKENPLQAMFGASSMPLPFQLSKDLTLFRNDKEGPINVLWGLLDKSDGLKTGNFGLQMNATAGFFLVQSFLRGDRLYPPQALTASPLPEVQNIYQTIHKGYFNNESISDADLALLDPSLHDWSNDPFSRWLDEYAVASQANDQMNAKMLVDDGKSWIQEVPAKDYEESQNKLPTIQIVFGFDLLFKGLDFAFSQIFDQQALSPYCTEYMKGLQAGELDSYVGNQLSSGYKPGETGIKPGETGIKSGETGIKPGETGIKPQLSIVRPCLNIGREL